MGFFSDKKKQKEQDPAIVQAALYGPDKAKRGEAIKQLVDQELLFQIAMRDADEWIRLTAALQLTDQKQIFEVITKGPEGRVKVSLLDKITKDEYLFNLQRTSENIETRWYAMGKLNTNAKRPNFKVCSFYHKDLLKRLAFNEHVRYHSIFKSGDQAAIRAIAADESSYKREDVEARLAAVARLRSQEDLLFVVDAIVDVTCADTYMVLWALLCEIEDKSKLIELLRMHKKSWGNFTLHEWLGISDQFDLVIPPKTSPESKTSPPNKSPHKELDPADLCDATGLFEDFNFKLLVVEDLLAKAPAFGHDLARLRDETLPLFKYSSDGPIAEIVSFLSKLELSQAELDKVTRLCFDGGNKIYEFIQPDWDGEDGLFDVHSVKGFERLRNLKSVWFGGGLCEDAVLYPIRDAGIAIEGRELR